MADQCNGTLRTVRDLEAELRPLLPPGAGEFSVLADSHNLVLRAGELVIRVQPITRMDDATARLLVEFLNGLGPDVRAPKPVRLANGEWFAKLTQPYRVMLVTWVPGEREPDARTFIEPERLRAIGAMVAHMHAGSPNEAARGVELEAVRGPVFQSELAEPARFNAALEVLAELEHPPVGLIHADLEPQNWVFDGGRPGVIDFDEFRRGPLGNPDHYTALAFVRWFEFVFGELTAEQRERHRPYIEPMAARVVEWCSP